MDTVGSQVLRGPMFGRNILESEEGHLFSLLDLLGHAYILEEGLDKMMQYRPGPRSQLGQTIDPWVNPVHWVQPHAQFDIQLLWILFLFLSLFY